MFGLTFEKLLLVAVVAGLLVGPHRLPVYAQRLADLVRTLRGLLADARTQAEREMGVSLQGTDWESLDPRRYDPRRIVRDALDEPADLLEPTEAPSAELLEEAQRVRPGQRYLVTGSAAHPRRVLIASLPEDDPRRRAAEVD
ncbi:Sec-independent protein translocase subunit TatA/TatB [Nocardioides humi]|uniref:Twin-arginine translocase TatA/TatE family subunit n=1 Tax=Nocardioides humi TaxID=449461 RepID=A0ABN2B0I4_9ACTN|nr:preprotein translocase [Nocardioides humi]